MEDWFYQLSTKSWDAPKEHFLSQWKLLNCCITGKRLCSPVWLIGDFGMSVSIHDSLIAGGWSEVNAGKADFSNIWCSRKRETQTCTSDNRMYRGYNSEMIIDVKEDTL